MKLNVVVSGCPCDLDVRTTERIRDVIEAARIEGRHVGNDGEWEARNRDGRYLDPGITVKDAGLVDGQTVYINPRAGIGASPEPS